MNLLIKKLLPEKHSSHFAFYYGIQSFKKFIFWIFWLLLMKIGNWRHLCIKKKLTEAPFYTLQVSILNVWSATSYMVSLWDWEEYVVKKRIIKLRLKKCLNVLDKGDMTRHSLIKLSKKLTMCIGRIIKSSP